jgi:hypothetical protein
VRQDYREWKVGKGTRDQLDIREIKDQLDVQVHQV